MQKSVVVHIIAPLDISNFQNVGLEMELHDFPPNVHSVFLVLDAESQQNVFVYSQQRPARDVVLEENIVR